MQVIYAIGGLQPTWMLHGYLCRSSTQREVGGGGGGILGFNGPGRMKKGEEGVWGDRVQS